MAVPVRRSAPSRWRSSGARRSSGSSSASTSSTRSSSPALIYPLGAHWVFGGGSLHEIGLGMQDFAGSTGGPPDRRHRRARRAAAARPAPRQVRPGRQAAGDPGPQHAAVRPRRADPVARLVRLQRRARRSDALDGRFAEVTLVTQLAAAAGVHRRLAGDRLLEDQGARHRHGRQRRDRRRSSASPPRRATSSRGPALIIGAHRRRDRPARRLRDRQEARRPGRRALRARPVRHLGHARVRPVHLAAAGRVQRRSARAACSTRARSTSSACRRSASSSSFAFVFTLSLRDVLG